MLIPDVNVLLYAYFEEAPGHTAARAWLDGALFGDDIIGAPDAVLAGFIRIATNSTLYARPAGMREAFAAAARFHVPPTGWRLLPGPRHWEIFEEIALSTGIGSKDVSDAYLAAFAIENDATFVTFDRGFTRFPGLRVFVPE